MRVVALIKLDRHRTRRSHPVQHLARPRWAPATRTRRQGLVLRKAQTVPLTRGYVEPEVGFEPTTFRLRVGCSASDQMAPDGSSLLTLAASSVQTAPDGSRPIVWMIKWMIKAHPIERRMLSEVGSR